MTNEQLEQRVNDIQFQLDDVKNTRDPLRANQRIDLLEQKIEAFGVRIEELGQKLNAFGKDDKYIELFTDDEFKLLYNNSGLGAKDVASLMKANEKFKDMDCTPPTISKIINGERGSLELRSYLGKQFRFAITKRKDI
jgi:hypothetical protein